MKNSALFVILCFLSFYQLEAQSRTYRYAKECSHLRGDNENYGLAEGASASWCDMSKPTPYTKCLCEVEKNNKQFVAEREASQASYLAVFKETNELRRQARKLGDAGNYEEALAMLRDRVMPLAENLETEGDAARKEARGLEIKYTNDAISSIISMQEYEEPKTLTLSAGGSSGTTNTDEGSINGIMDRVMSNSSSSANTRRPTTAETHEKHVAENNARNNNSNSSSNNRAKTQSSGPSQEELDRREKAADYARKQAKLEQENRQRQEYSQWKNQQNQKNAQVAAATAAGTISMLAILGKMIYQNMGMVDYDDVYQNKPALSISAEFGYSFLIQPIYFNSEVYDGVDFKNNTDYDFTWPVNFDFKFKLGYESEYVGAYGFGGLGIGASVVMHSFNAPTYNYGGQIFAGLPNIKGLFEYQGGGRAISQNYWMLEEESGSAYSSTSYNQIRYGARFTWGQFTRSHLSLGLINEGLTGVDDTQVQRIELPEAYNIEDRFITGYFLEYKKDHSFNFFVNIYPNYPFTGEVNYNIINNTDTDYTDGSMYFLVGFHRSLDLFY
jgi:hypothetical protein